MKWLLISSFPNPGDTFIRMGIEQLIRKVDKTPTFCVIDKMLQRSELDAFSADKIVWCGMPFFWSFSKDHSSITTVWREPLLLWLYKERKRDFLILGAGTVGLCAESVKEAFSNRDDIARTLEEAMDGSFDLTVRDDCLKFYGINTDLDALPCPSIFAHEQATPTPSYFVCNFMEHGGHYAELSAKTAGLWSGQLANFATDLRERGAIFAAHSESEVELARRHGFQATYNGPQQLLSMLSGAKKYVGNRIHGAIVAASAGAEATCYGFDLRLRAAQIAGVKPVYFNCTKLPEVEKYDIDNVRNSYLEILRKFID